MSEAAISTCRVNIGDAELHVEEAGAGPVVLLVSGLGGRGAFWRGQMAPLAEHFRTITFDHRGCGSSTPGLTVENIAHMAGDVLALMDALEIERVHLVGHSTGGAIGQHLALNAPERLSKLILSCSWPGPDAYFTELFRHRREVLEQCGPRDYLSSGTFLAMPGAILQRQMAGAGSNLEERLAAFPGLEVELSRIAAVMGHDLRARLLEICLPTLCIGAADDQITPTGFTEEMAAAIPGAALEILPRGGHFCPMAETAAYNARIIPFLTS